MELRRVLAAIALVCALRTTGSAAQVCGTTVDITEDREQLLVNLTGITRLCLRCINPTTMTPETGTIWDFDEQPRTLRNGDTSDDGQIRALNGIAEITNPQTKIMDGPDPYELECVGATYSHTRVELYTNTFLAPVPSPALAEEIVGNNAVLSCDDNNPSPQQPSFEWRNSSGAVVNNFRIYQIEGVMEEQAGVYTCTFISGLTGETLSADVTLVVQFTPRVRTEEAAMQTINEGATLILVCLFEAIPIPDAVFFRDNVAINDTADDRVSVVTFDSSSTLTIMDINRDEAGDYTCTLTNLVGSDTESITSLTVFVVPDPVIGLTATTIDERAITITWSNSNGFVGNTPITGARIEYFEEGQAMQTESPTGMPTMFRLTGLTPLALHNISVVLINAAGESEPRSIIATTLSLLLEEPVGLAVTALSSTLLKVTWNAPPPLPTTAVPESWTIEISESPSGDNMDSMTVPANELMVAFPDLAKGTNYRVRVAGMNTRGLGTFTGYVEQETLIDPPSQPLNVNVFGVASFALNVTWDPPMDNGGRPILRHIVTINSTETMVEAPDNYLLFRSNEVLMENTTYEVTVAAENVQSIGNVTTAFGTTIAITQPQPVLDLPEATEPTNISIVLMWPVADGVVDLYLVQYTLRRTGETFNETVNGTMNMVVLSGLEPDATYSVVVFTMNSNGLSVASPLAQFDTALPPDPVLTGPPETIMEGEPFELTCTSPDTSKPIVWQLMGSTDPLPNPPASEQDGMFGTSTLRVRSALVSDSGEYLCQVGDTESSFTVTVVMVPVEPTDGGIDTNTVIIAACVGGGGLILIIGIIIAIMLMCYCCRDRDSSSSRERTTKFKGKALKPDKRTKELFEVSTGASYVPVTDRGMTDAGVSFNMPEDYQAHSSFNTLDKPPKRSSSPEATNTSFGARTSTDNLTGGSPPRYQDFNPSGDGTVL